MNERDASASLFVCAIHGAHRAASGSGRRVGRQPTSIRARAKPL